MSQTNRGDELFLAVDDAIDLLEDVYNSGSMVGYDKKIQEIVEQLRKFSDAYHCARKAKIGGRLFIEHESDSK